MQSSKSNNFVDSIIYLLNQFLMKTKQEEFGKQYDDLKRITEKMMDKRAKGMPDILEMEYVFTLHAGENPHLNQDQKDANEKVRYGCSRAITTLDNYLFNTDQYCKDVRETLKDPKKDYDENGFPNDECRTFLKNQIKAFENGDPNDPTIAIRSRGVKDALSIYDNLHHNSISKGMPIDRNVAQMRRDQEAVSQPTSSPSSPSKPSPRQNSK